jgi:hypothetical protein
MPVSESDAADSKRSFGWIDLLIFAGILGLLGSIFQFGVPIGFDQTN